MIKITDINGRSHFLSPNDIARITEAGVSSQWHGISAIVKTMNGCTIEARETAVEIAAKLTTAAAMAAKDIHGHGDLTSRIKELEHEAILMLARIAELEAKLAEGAQAVRWAPSSAYWSNELRRIFGPEAREGIDTLEARLREAQDVAEAKLDEKDTLLRQALTDEHKAILKECRNQAMRWTLDARIPEAGAFGAIAQDLDYLCAQLGVKND
jgi:hypothetical protein